MTHIEPVKDVLDANGNLIEKEIWLGFLASLLYQKKHGGRLMIEE